jgi:hypothetical protein
MQEVIINHLLYGYLIELIIFDVSIHVLSACFVVILLFDVYACSLNIYRYNLRHWQFECCYVLPKISFVTLHADIYIFCRNHRGLRHYWGLRVRGQHTKTTGRRGKTVGVSKKR